jgi:hypothetical protein
VNGLDSFPWIQGRAVGQQEQPPDSTDGFPWIQSRDTYATYPADYPFPEAIEASKKLSELANKRDASGGGADSSPPVGVVSNQEEIWETESQE